MTLPGMASSGTVPAAPRSEEQLESALSTPTSEVIDALRTSPGDVVILGAGGKMGPSLARMAQRAAETLDDGRRIFAVSRFGDSSSEHGLKAAGVETIRTDLLDRRAVDRLPDAPNVIFMAGQKFGTSAAPAVTWAMNVLVPAHTADRYADSRIVAFSTGNVYPLSPVHAGGSTESDAPAPVGEYAQSCLGRERMFEFHCQRSGGALALIRLNYACALRYGVLTDLAIAVRDGTPIDLTMGYVNVIWQGDANAMAIRSLTHASQPPFVINLTGPELLSVRDVALTLGERLGRAPKFVGTEAPDALLSNASRAMALFGPLTVSARTLIDWTADWIAGGGATLGKPTKFQARDGGF